MRKIILLSAVFVLARGEGQLAPTVRCLDESDFGVTLEFVLEGEYAETVSTQYGNFVRFHIPNGGFVGQVGAPEIPSFSTLVAAFGEKGATVKVLKVQWDSLENINLYPAQDPFSQDDFSYDPAAYRDGIYPERLVDVGAPAILRDFRVIPVNFYPFRYDAKTKELLIARKITVRVNFDIHDPRNSKPKPAVISGAFARIYQSVIANYWYYARNENLRRGTILYIARDDFVDDIQPLLEWRQERGYRVRVARAYADIGGGDAPSADDILNYIQNAYDNWEYPPDYVVLVGDVAMGGTFLPDYDYYSPFIGETYASDYRYSLLDGDDYFADVMVGRISVDNEVEAQTYANKVVHYEANPLARGSEWLRRGAIIAANCCGTPTPTTPRLMSLWLRELALRQGFTELDTFFCYGTTCPRGADEISSYINEGVAFVNYRGWGGAPGWTFPSFYVGDVMGLSNVDMTPFVTSIVCGTGDFNSSTSDPAFCEAWIRAGTPAAPRGGVDFYGPSDHDTHTKWNNPNCEGFYWGLFEENLHTFGQCALRGKITLYLSYPDNRGPGDGVEHYLYVYNIIGDPSVNLWKSVPRELTVDAPENLPRGATQIALNITSAGNPVDSALVSVWFFDGDPITIFSASDGSAVVPLPAEQTLAADSFSLVVSKPGYAPFKTVVHISGENRTALAGCILLDSATDSTNGNGDGLPSPGETIALVPEVANISGGDLSDIIVKILPDTMFEIVDSVSAIAEIPAGDTVSGDAVIIALSHEIPDSFQIGVRFAISYGAGTDTAAYPLNIRAPLLKIEGITPAGDSILSPGETSEILVRIKNIGSVSTRAGELHLSGGIRVLPASNGTIPAIPPDSEGVSAGISVSADDGLINGIVDHLTLEFDDGFYRQRLELPITVGEITSSTFGGPDIRGYYCYDNTDIESGRAPEYEWIEISPYEGGDGTDLNLGDDETVNIPLPFTFNYYGYDYDTIGVCSNGWIGLGAVKTWIFNNFYNRPLPDPSGPWGMICPFWDDLDPSVVEGHGVFYKYIEDWHIFVIEWHTVNAHDRTTVEWFEVILRDPAYYPAQADVGEILFQYREIADVDSLEGNPNSLAEYSTIGIEDPTQSVAIQYKFCGELAPHAAEIEPGRAIMFTTNPPTAVDTSEIHSAPKPKRFDLSAAPNPFNSAQKICVSLPENSHLRVEITDLAGRAVRVLCDGTYPAGERQIVWDGKSGGGAPLPSGIYLIRAETDDNSITRKTVLIK